MSRAIFVSGVLRMAGWGFETYKRMGPWPLDPNGCHKQLREQRLATHR